MRLSRKCDYALRALILMASKDSGAYHGIAPIAKAEDIPLRYLEQVFLALKNAGILSSKSGPSGGYKFRRSPEEISLVDIVRIIDGPVAPARCVSQTAYEPCPREGSCSLRPVLADVRQAIADILKSITLADACKKAGMRAEAGEKP
jgi:Rrf2 family transcriptional regulator, cysteine metabolism repressor